MRPTSSHIQRVYLTLTLFNTLAASLIWGINTLFLLHAGLSNSQAFLANAFFTVGQVLFEVPTGIVADLKGRRLSYLLGTVTLALSTLWYLWAWYMKAPFVWWALSSMLLGLGFTFFSGATEAWLVDALESARFKGSVDSVFAKAQSVGGIAMLVGSIGGGIIAQLTNLGVPYILRSILLGVTFVIAFVFMKDWGFTPKKRVNLRHDFKQQFVTGFELGWKNRQIRLLMLAGPVISAVGFYTFYALQPFLLGLFGDSKAYAIAGAAAAIVAGSQIVGGISIPFVQRIFPRRSDVLIASTLLSVALLLIIAFSHSFWLVIGLLCLWGFVSSVATPVRQAYMNSLIPSRERATVLSFDNMFGSAGGAVIQPVLGKVADIYSYSSSFLVGSLAQLVALPFLWKARQEEK
ncbi:MAG TPA: MFS transporter [Patescibacteria group bacterium]|nr:MFS transporter [Patescibacteria group bacterium]